MAEVTWPIIVPDGGQAVWAAATTDAREQAEDWATAILWALSGRAFGTVLEHVRPDPKPLPGGSTYAGTSPTFLSGGYRRPPATNGYDPGGCRWAVKRLYLPGPIAEIVEVGIGAATLDPDAYRVINGSYVRRVDGQFWPRVQNLDADDGEVGAWFVTYERGMPVPPAGQLAAGVLAVEYLLDRAGSGECRLPRGVTSMSRQGMTVEVDARAYFTEGMTGVDEVDQWLLSVNPHRISRPARMVGGRPYVDVDRRQP